MPLPRPLFSSSPPAPISRYLPFAAADAVAIGHRRTRSPPSLFLLLSLLSVGSGDFRAVRPPSQFSPSRPRPRRRPIVTALYGRTAPAPPTFPVLPLLPSIISHLLLRHCLSLPLFLPIVAASSLFVFSVRPHRRRPLSPWSRRCPKQAPSPPRSRPPLCHRRLPLSSPSPSLPPSFFTADLVGPRCDAALPFSFFTDTRSCCRVHHLRLSIPSSSSLPAATASTTASFLYLHSEFC